MPISHKQKQILAFQYTKYDALICDGAIRSGKTVFMTIAFIDDIMRRYDKTKAAICGKTVSSAIENVVKPYMAIAYPNKKYSMRFNRADKLLTISDGKHTNVFEIFGGRDESSYALIQGRTLSGVLIDEVALQPRSFVEQAVGRCSVEGSKFWFNCNPESPQHWFYKEWICDLMKHNAYHLHFQLEDNPSLSEKMIARYKAMYSGVFYDRYILGRWTLAEGLIYEKYEQAFEEPHEFKVSDICVSLDYGTQNAFAAIMWAKDSSGIWHGVKEYYYSGREKGIQKTDEEYLQDLVEFVYGDTDEEEMPRGVQVIVDPSAASFIASLRKCGLFKVRKAKNNVLDGIRHTASALNNGYIKLSKNCNRLHDEMSTYSWDTKSNEDRPVKVDDHACDAMRYFVETKKVYNEDKQPYQSIFGG